MEAYYESYRKSLQKDIIPGFNKYAANQTLRSDKFPTFEKFLFHIVANIKASIADKNEEQFAFWLMEHKKSIFKLCNKMLTEAAPKDPLHYGWGGYKFSSIILPYPDKGYSFVPWASQLKDEPGVVVSAGEMITISQNWSLLDAVYDWKREKPCYITVENGKLTQRPIHLLNEDTVIDWTGRLRYEQ